MEAAITKNDDRSRDEGVEGLQKMVKRCEACNSRVGRAWHRAAPARPGVGKERLQGHSAPGDPGLLRARTVGRDAEEEPECRGLGKTELHKAWQLGAGDAGEEV